MKYLRLKIEQSVLKGNTSTFIPQDEFTAKIFQHLFGKTELTIEELKEVLEDTKLTITFDEHPHCPATDRLQHRENHIQWRNTYLQEHGALLRRKDGYYNSPIVAPGAQRLLSKINKMQESQK